MKGEGRCCKTVLKGRNCGRNNKFIACQVFTPNSTNIHWLHDCMSHSGTLASEFTKSMWYFLIVHNWAYNLQYYDYLFRLAREDSNDSGSGKSEGEENGDVSILP